MNRKITNLLPFFCVCLNYSVLIAQVDSTKSVSSIHFSANYSGDLVSNFNGGIKTGTTYLGLANLKVGFDTENASWWKGGKFFLNLGNTHGGQPSADLVGDFQGISNIEAGNISFVYELWYRQHFGNFAFTFGLQDLNADFSVSEYGALFTNSSFGIHSSIADNVPSPIFPLTALGFSIKWDLNERYSLAAAVFDGTPDDFENNPYNINWKLSKSQGFLAVTELQIKKSLINDMYGAYKLGFYYHQHDDNIDLEQKNRGFYFVADQQINERLSLFSQIGLSPKSINENNHYYSLGVNYTGLFKKRPNDVCGIAVAFAGIDKNSIGSETTVELTYKFELNKNIYFRPDLQYIINPAGTSVKLENAFVGFIRLGIEL